MKTRYAWDGPRLARISARPKIASQRSWRGKGHDVFNARCSKVSLLLLCRHPSCGQIPASEPGRDAARDYRSRRQTRRQARTDTCAPTSRRCCQPRRITPPLGRHELFSEGPASLHFSSELRDTQASNHNSLPEGYRSASTRSVLPPKDGKWPGEEAHRGYSRPARVSEP